MFKSNRRILIYILILIGLCLIINFHRLGDRPFYGDEAIYAYVMKNMEISGSWIDFRFNEPDAAYLQKPPLYFWLTAIVRPLFSDEELAYRFWSALFGMGCVLLTFLLGSSLIGLEAGFVAAVLLATNHVFLFQHGVRHGTMDSGVTFLCLGGATAIWLALTRGRPGLWWFVAGLMTGTICILKGSPQGVLAFVLLALVWFIYSKGIRFRFVKPLLGVLGAVLVAGPWFVAQWIRFGALIELQHLSRFKGDLHPDHAQGPWFYLEEITRSSSPFLLFVPAMAIALLYAFQGNQRRQYGLISLFGMGWIFIISLSASKLIWYAFPAFPFVALVISGVGVGVLTTESKRLRRHRLYGTIPFIIAGTTTFLAVISVIGILGDTIPFRNEKFRDIRWDIHQSESVRNAKDLKFIIMEGPNDDPDAFRDYYRDFEMTNLQYADSLSSLQSMLNGSGVFVLAVDRMQRPEWVAALDERLRNSESIRLESIFHVVYLRGIEPDIEHTELVQRRRLDGAFLSWDRALEFASHEVDNLLGQGWEISKPGSLSRWSEGTRSELLFDLEAMTPILG